MTSSLEYSEQVLRLTIITITFSSAATLEQTFRSVASQIADGIRVEYIVVDGGSTDGTVELIKEWEKKGLVTRWITEPDAGMYDAMNKGIAMATGDYVCMLNSDDELAEGALEKIQSAAQKDPPYFYGHNYLRNVDGEVFEERLMPGRIIISAMCCHQALWVRRDVLQDVGEYRIDAGTGADEEFMIRLRHAYGPGLFLNDYLCVFFEGGESSRNSYRESTSKLRLQQVDKVVDIANADQLHSELQMRDWSTRVLMDLKGAASETNAQLIRALGDRLLPRNQASFVSRLLFRLTYQSYVRSNRSCLRKLTRLTAVLLNKHSHFVYRRIPIDPETNQMARS